MDVSYKKSNIFVLTFVVIYIKEIKKQKTIIMQKIIILFDICAILLIAGFLHPPKLHIVEKSLGGESHNNWLMNLFTGTMVIAIVIAIFLPIGTAILVSVWYLIYSIGFVLMVVGGFYMYLKISAEMAWRGALKYEKEHGLSTLSRNW